MTPPYQIWNCDCVQGMFDHLPDGSVDHVVTSIPFEALFSYSHKTEDLGNNPSTVDIHAGQFGLNMRFFVEQLYRVLAPGAVVSVHVQQLLAYKNLHGYIGRRDFVGAVITLFTRRLDERGRRVSDWFDHTGEWVIAKDPVAAANRHQLHSLQFKQGREVDARVWAPWVNDYLLVFRKPGDGGKPVRCLYDPISNPHGWVTREEWRAWACGVWNDIHEIDVLSGWQSARETDEEKHVCPLQLEVIRRSLSLYSSPGDLVLDPFFGIGSTGYVALGGASPITKLALKDPRRVVGFELKESYYRQALANCERAITQRETPDAPTLFSWLETLQQEVA